MVAFIKAKALELIVKVAVRLFYNRDDGLSRSNYRPKLCRSDFSFTNPLIGNYGITLADYESLEPQIKGVICHQVARRPDNWRMQTTLPKFLKALEHPWLARN